MSDFRDDDPTDVDAKRLEAAGHWLLRFNGHPMSEEDMAEWIQWCEADAENLPAYEHIRSTWQRFGRLKEQFDIGPVAPDEPARRRRWRIVASAASILLAIGICIYAFSHRVQPLEIASDRRNEVSVLSDGSSIELSGRSRIAVDFTPTRRALTLYPGRAFFSVHPDKTRPFVVHAGSFNVTAVGTRFDVRQAADSTTITVEEGVVRIARADGAGAGWQLDAGFQFVSSAGGKDPRILAVDTPDALAWREGRLVYESDALGQIVNDINRYSRHRVVINDPAVASLSFSGTVFTNSIDDWLASVTTAFRLHARALANGDTLLERTEK